MTNTVDPYPLFKIGLKTSEAFTGFGYCFIREAVWPPKIWGDGSIADACCQVTAIQSSGQERIPPSFFDP